ncbi:MAG TPA: DUF4340 domain-containing protein [Kofleriaceae bacterium]|nr:DUF4340 domain-containing protein [Kofleriaceae bacterium]
MKTGPIIHGALLVVALGFAYRGLTKDETPDHDLGHVAVWTMPEGSVTAIAYDDDDKSVKIEVKHEGDESYLWGTESRIRKVRKAKPAEPADKDAAGDADKDKATAAAKDKDKSNDKTAAKDKDKAAAKDADKDKATAATKKEPAEPEMTTETVVTEFPVGDHGDELVKNFTALKALRDLGPLSDEAKKTYELADTKRQVTVFFKGGKQKTLSIGGNVYGSGDRYVLDPETGHGYAMAGDVLRPLSSGQAMLRLNELHAYDAKDVKSAVVTTDAGKQKMVRTDPDGEGGKAPGWADAKTPKELSQTLGNFVDRIAKLRAREFSPDQDMAKVTEIATVTYLDDDGEKLGYLSLYKHEPTPGEANDEADGTAPKVKGETTEYFLRTERTRVLGVVSPLAAGRILQDLDQIFGAKDADSPASSEGTTPGAPAKPAPASKAPATKTPATKAPATKTPATKTPATKAPAVKPPAKNPVKNPAQYAPI